MKTAWLLIATLSAPLMAQRFYADDPLDREPRPRDASGAVSRKISDYYDFFLHTFGHPGAPAKTAHEEVAALGVNTLGEPMDGAWYTKRHYYRRMTLAELAAGPGADRAPSMDTKWTVMKAKSEGVTPGFEIVDGQGRRYVLKFDPAAYPELSTAADVIGSKFFYALGYHVPENYIVRFRMDQLQLRDGVKLRDHLGRERAMNRSDLEQLLHDQPRDSEGRYRALASLYLEGKPLGPFKYFGTRKDDPNDTVLHEHRRDLRGLRVFAAWLGHDDSRAINTLDMLVKDGSTSYIRHHLIDFGSILGSASYGPNSPRSGFEHIFAWKPAFRQIATLGMAPPDWAGAKFGEDPALGRYESDKFDPTRWLPEYPNPAFDNMLPEDAFWAAKQVLAFTDADIRAIVATGEYSNSQTAEQLAKLLIQRRDKIGEAFANVVLPLDRFQVNEDSLRFDEVLLSPKTYTYRWSVMDDKGHRDLIPAADSPRIPSASRGVLDCEISDGLRTLHVYLNAEARQVVGIARR